jgi:NAD(P)H-flavin reductase
MTSGFGRVNSVEKESHDTFTLTVKPLNGAAPGGFLPGQFSMLYVFGVGELPISISGDPNDPSKLVYTVRAVGQATHSLVTRAAGDRLGIRGPFGTHWPVEAARGRDLIIVAGGIGLAPLRPVIYHVLANRQDFGRLTLLYGARSPKDLLYRKQLAAWKKAPNTQILTSVDHGGLKWRGQVGVVTKLFRFVRLHPERTSAMVCGPEIMMRFVVRELLSAGLAPADIYLSMERNMKCAVGLCGHCQLGPYFVCKDGPVFSYDSVAGWMDRYEL